MCVEFANAFTLKQVEVAAKEKKLYVDLLKAKPESNPEEEEVTRISDSNPIDDFNKMIKDRKVDRVADALRQMQDYIIRLLENDYKGNMYKKAIECLNVLRGGCIEEDETGIFNAFLAIKVKGLQSAHVEFWNLMVSEGINLITNAENKTSLVTPQEAKNFLVKIEANQIKISSMDLDEIE